MLHRARVGGNKNVCQKFSKVNQDRTTQSSLQGKINTSATAWSFMAARLWDANQLNTLAALASAGSCWGRRPCSHTQRRPCLHLVGRCRPVGENRLQWAMKYAASLYCCCTCATDSQDDSNSTSWLADCWTAGTFIMLRRCPRQPKARSDDCSIQTIWLISSSESPAPPPSHHATTSASCRAAAAANGL